MSDQQTEVEDQEVKDYTQKPTATIGDQLVAKGQVAEEKEKTTAGGSDESDDADGNLAESEDFMPPALHDLGLESVEISTKAEIEAEERRQQEREEKERQQERYKAMTDDVRKYGRVLAENQVGLVKAELNEGRTTEHKKAAKEYRANINRIYDAVNAYEKKTGDETFRGRVEFSAWCARAEMIDPEKDGAFAFSEMDRIMNWATTEPVYTREGGDKPEVSRYRLATDEEAEKFSVLERKGRRLPYGVLRWRLWDKKSRRMDYHAWFAPNDPPADEEKTGGQKFLESVLNNHGNTEHRPGALWRIREHQVNELVRKHALQEMRGASPEELAKYFSGQYAELVNFMPGTYVMYDQAGEHTLSRRDPKTGEFKEFTTWLPAGVIVVEVKDVNKGKAGREAFWVLEVKDGAGRFDWTRSCKGMWVPIPAAAFGKVSPKTPDGVRWFAEPFVKATNQFLWPEWAKKLEAQKQDEKSENENEKQ